MLISNKNKIQIDITTEEVVMSFAFTSVINPIAAIKRITMSDSILLLFSRDYHS